MEQYLHTKRPLKKIVLKLILKVQRFPHETIIKLITCVSMCGYCKRHEQAFATNLSKLVVCNVHAISSSASYMVQNPYTMQSEGQNLYMRMMLGIKKKKIQKLILILLL